jgi:enamine deaminase RidA (YjgF/YER057c/UK114 family)
MKLDVKTIESNGASELYICATPDSARGDAAETAYMFQAVADAVNANGARPCRERVFVPGGQLEAYRDASCRAFPQKVAPADDWLLAGGPGAIGGVQVHAVRGATDWRPLFGRGGEPGGWTFAVDGQRWAVTRGLLAPAAGDATVQARAAFEAGEDLLRQAGMDLTCVARTWLFMDDILAWYGDFNRMRNDLFIARGLLRRRDESGGDTSRVPASTGIGVTPARAGRVSLEMFATTGGIDGGVKRYSAAGKQRSAYEYGSAFARASESHTPAGRTVFVSGTAAIDESGATCYVGDAKGQIRMTLECVLAVLRSAACGPADVVQAIAYCKTPEVAKAFAAGWQQELAWPWVVVIGDVCRDDLLFEVEVTACAQGGHN